MTWTRFLLAAALALAVPGPAPARVVGIVFDDSGSMAGQIHLPAFGVQLLLGSLDGRDGRDRVLTARLSQFATAFESGNNTYRIPPGGPAEWIAAARGAALFRLEDLRTAELQQAAVDDVARNWAVPRTATPYEPVELILARVIEALKPEEDGHVVVVTDGEFNVVPDGAELDRRLQQLRGLLVAKKATLAVDFVAIGIKDPATLGKIDQQQVRERLLATFNGDARTGRHDVTSAAELTEAMKDIIARVARTDRRAQGAYIGVDRDTIVIDSPLSIARIVSVATATRPTAPPQLTRPPAQPQTVRIRAQMRDADRSGGLLAGDIRQLRFQPGLAPGRHTVTYDRAVGGDAFLLFETNAVAAVAVTAPDGTAVARDPAGAVRLVSGADYRLDVSLLDQSGGGVAQTPLASFGSRATFTATVEDGRGAQAVTLTLDTARNVATGTFRAGAPGRYAARGQMRLSGFVTPPSKPADLEVVDTRLGLTATVTPHETCAGCAAGEIGAALTPGGSTRDIATVTIAGTGALAGSGTVTVAGLPDWLALADAAGTVATGGRAAVRIDPAAPARLSLRVLATVRPSGAEPATLTLKVAADPPLVGEAATTVVVRPQVPAARLVATGSAKGGPDLAPPLSGRELLDGTVPFDFVAEGVLTRPSAAEIATTFADPLAAICLGARPTTADFRVQVVPSTRWYCPALLWFANGPQRMTVAYRSADGLQTAAATVPLVLAITDWEALVAAAKILGAIAGLAYAVFWLMAIAATRRFPRGAVLEVVEGRDLPRYLPLRGTHLTFLKALAGPRHETRRVEGLHLTADSGGARLNLQRSQGDIVIATLGRSVREILEEAPRHPEVRVIWNDEMERPGRPKMTMRLRRAIGDTQ